MLTIVPMLLWLIFAILYAHADMVSDIHAIKLKYCGENIKTKNKNIPPQIKAMDEEGVIIEDLSDKQ